MLRILLVGLLGIFGGLPLATASTIDEDEHVILFPTHAHRDGDHWVVPIHAWVFEPEEDSLLRGASLELIQFALGIEDADPANPFLDRRARMFLVDNERDKELTIRIGGQRVQVQGETGSEGHLRSEIRLPAADWEDQSEVHYSVVLATGDPRRFEGVSYLVEDTGLTVISDVDDTIKISYVTDKEKLLRKTFLEPFQAAPGMARRFRDWQQEGAAFVFVSSSPWQLHEEIRGLLESACFPSAVMSLKTFRIKDSRFFDLFADPFESKVRRIESIIASHPDRDYILVGDSGEKDPEVYGEIRRRHPQRIRQVYIRNVTAEAAGSPRWNEAFDQVPKGYLTLLDPTGPSDPDCPS